MLWRSLGLLLLTALVGLGGCATTGGNPRDPLEGYNRVMFGFNDGLDKVVIKPVASGYKAVIPEFARMGVTNFFSNLGDIWIGINNILQGKVTAGAGDFGRFAMNSTIGILGLFDLASNAGLEKHNEDFGQTLGRWGMGSGAYVVLPILGPSNVRDGFSTLFVDWHFDPLWYVGDVSTRNAVITFRFIERRAGLLDVSNLAEEAALDHYAYIRDAFLQRRRSLIYDGEPPPEADPEKSSESGVGKDNAAPAEAGLQPPQDISPRIERAITAADEEPAPAQPVAVRPEAEGVIAAAHEPGAPNNSDSLPAVAVETRAGLAPNTLRP